MLEGMVVGFVRALSSYVVELKDREGDRVLRPLSESISTQYESYDRTDGETDGQRQQTDQKGTQM